MHQTTYAQTEELPFINAAELCEDCLGFTVESIVVKENVVTKHGVQDVAYVKIAIDGARYILSAKQSVLLKQFRAMKAAREAGTDPNPLDQVFYIAFPEGKSYYDLFIE